MTSSNSKKNYEFIKSLIPLYVKGTLADSDKEEFEKALNEYPELKDEIAKWQSISSAYKEIEDKLPEPSPWIYSKINEKIKEKQNLSLYERCRILLERFIPSKKLSLAIIFAQLLIIVTLGIYAINLKTEYITLSTPSTVTENTIKINVVFIDNALEVEIRRLLTEVEGKIIDGPYISGLYVIGISPNKQVDRVLDELRKSKIVVMAERAY